MHVFNWVRQPKYGMLAFKEFLISGGISSFTDQLQLTSRQKKEYQFAYYYWHQNER